MESNHLRLMLKATGEEIYDDGGQVIGYVAQPARIRVNQDHLARGGFLVVTRDEETGYFTGTEFDALPHPKTGEAYPAGHSAQAWQVSDLDAAIERVLSYFPTRPDRSIDLRGDVCPITFAKTKIALEEMEIGQILQVILDWEPAVSNVPRSAEIYGDEMIKVETLSTGEWAVLIRKRVD
jgi:tRNA 2-thiouridine synthesizing protein A